jgi:hypothetical protein
MGSVENARIVFRKPGESAGVIVDAEGYRGRREDSLTDLSISPRRSAPSTGSGHGSTGLNASAAPAIVPGAVSDRVPARTASTRRAGLSIPPAFNAWIARSLRSATRTPAPDDFGA